jgi:hypothetical protein
MAAKKYLGEDMMLTCIWSGALRTLSHKSPGECHNRSGDGRSMQPFEAPPLFRLAHFGKINESECPGSGQPERPLLVDLAEPLFQFSN